MARKIVSPKAPEKIAPTATEISVARNGFLKPYAVSFQHLPDNIAREPLGMLAGVMIIQDRSEHSAYIVNFLSSLAKKEYYGNPRRGAIESFESALHKVNIGLAELAKEGNTEWIGTLDAALCIIERNNLHFSVAGNAKVLLFRERHLSDISEGLADSDNDHPMKTFTDVASGKISPGDRILITTPELFSILSETELERSANRLPNDQFEQLLQTAVINQLDISASVCITIGTISGYERKPAPKRTLATIDSVPNAWSRAIFESSKQQGNSIEDGLREKKSGEQDRIDNKTGHIYVTGEAPSEESSETWERVHMFLENINIWLRHIKTQCGRNILPALRSGIQSIKTVSTTLSLKVRSALRSWQEKRRLSNFPIESALPPSTTERAPRNIPLAEATSNTMILGRSDRQPAPLMHRLSEKARRTLGNISSLSVFSRHSTVHIPVHDESRSAALFKGILQTGRVAFSKCAQMCRFLKAWLENLPAKKQKVLKISGLAILGISATFLLVRIFVVKDTSQTTAEEPSNAENTTTETPRELEQDINVHFIGQPSVIGTFSDIVSMARIQETLFLITKDAIYRAGSDGENATQIAYPDEKTARMGVAMPDLGALLIVTEDGTILFFTPATNRFSDERFVLPNAADVTHIAASSTYLYALNPTENTLSRYPRADGGFGSATSWFRESVSIQPESTIAVSDSVFVADSSGIHTYFRGILQTKEFESSTTPIFPTDISVSSQEDNGQLFVLDGIAGRIVQYDVATGAITAQYASDALQGATHFALDPSTKTAFVSIGNSVITVKME